MKKPTADTAAEIWKTADQFRAELIAGWVTKANPIPAGQLLTKIAMAVIISFPANQSATILVIKTFNKMAPIPLMRRPVAAMGKE